ncbi:MAG: Dyp-type peroxidase [Candidatus Binataceae bacterium]
MPESIDRADIQGIVASGYDHLDYACFVFLEITDRHEAQDWLRSIVAAITTAVYPESKSASCVNLALTWKGLIELGIPKEPVQNFPHEFVAGMNRPEAALILGDTGDSSKEHWLYGGDETQQSLHILVLLYGKSAPTIETLFDHTCSPNALGGGLRLLARQDAARRHGDLSEPFGFRDGISQPPVKGLIGRSRLVEDPIKTGEFVLGYENELGQLTRIPTVDAWQDPRGYLAGHPRLPAKLRAFGLNGTYLVFRRLSQNVKAFSDFVNTSVGNDPHLRERFAAKLVGRWKGGAPLVLAPEVPGNEPANDFLYMSDDPDGQRCPLGSHIRRANPRDSILMLPPWKSLQVSRRHRIVRRGRKYCELAKASTPDHSGYEQGLYFIALNADLRRQFEFIQQTWLNSPTFNGLDNDKDPIVSDNTGDGEFTIQAKPINCHFRGLERFVTVRGGGYFFVPGIRAIRFLANYQP